MNNIIVTVVCTMKQYNKLLNGLFQNYTMNTMLLF